MLQDVARPVREDGQPLAGSGLAALLRGGGAGPGGEQMGRLKWVKAEMGNQNNQLFVPGPPQFTKSVSLPSAFRITRFRLTVSDH